MKIAVTSTGPSIDDAVESRFGRCPYFIIIDPETMEFEAVANPNVTLGGGAGPQSAQLVAEKGASVVLTGNCGPKAAQTFDAAGIRVITGVSGQVRQAVQQYAAAVPAGKTASQAQNPLNTGARGGAGMGRGGGAGMGGGGGMGMGRGMGGGGGKGCGRRFR